MNERLNEQRKERVSAGMNERKERTRKNHSRICQDMSSKNGICREESKVWMHSTLKWWSVRKNHIHDTQGAAYSENVQAVRGHTHSQICHKEACCQQARSGGGINMWRRDKWMKTWANEPTQYQKREERAVRLNMCAWIRELLLEATSALSYLWPDLPLLWSIFSLSSVFPGQRLLWILRG